MVSKVNVVFDEGTVKTTTQTETGGGTVTVEQDALIITTAGPGLDLSPDSWKVAVNGLIDAAADDGLVFDVAGTGKSSLTIGTEGTIRTQDTLAAAVDLQSAADVTNAGVIMGGAEGILVGNLFSATGKGFTITNAATGSITGDIGISDLASNQFLTVKNLGTIAGTVSAIKWAGSAAITNSGLIHGDLVQTVAGAGVTTITNGGTIEGGVTLVDGTYKLTNSGTIDDAVTSVAGATTLNNSGELFSVALGGGADTFVNMTKGNVADTLDLGDGANKLTNGGSIGGVVTLGSDNDTMVNSGRLFSDLELGDGDNKATNSGMIFGDLTAGVGNDVIGNTKIITGTVALDDGNNTLTNGGTINGDVSAGSGHDVFTNTGFVVGTISLGSGDDVFTGGNAAEIVIDDAGNDTYKLGGGNDRLVLASGTDVADGGAGTDSVLLTGISTAATINLDTKAVTVGGQTLVASSAAATGIAATIKNFENATGGTGDDIIAGSAGANALSGADGADKIYGGLGADSLTGGAGTDTFVYLSIKESGNTRATRDTIEDFAAGDKIDLSAIDADTTKAGPDHFNLLTSANAEFTAAGDLRFYFDGTNTIVQGDINGDKKADFSIALVGDHTLTSSDFIL